MSDRVARVDLGTGPAVEVAGPAAELVALVACLALSPRTLGMLRRLVAHEAQIAPLRYARIEVDLTPTRAKLYYRRSFDQQSLGDWAQGEEETNDAA